MHNLNSLVTQLSGLYECLFSDLISHHPHHKIELLRDKKTVINRLKNEGIQFATSTLPSFGKAVYTLLEYGHLPLIKGFHLKKGTSYPRFLGGLMKEIATDDGALRTSFDTCFLADIIEVCFFVYKMDLPYSEKLNKKVIQSFIKTEEDLSELIINPDDPFLESCADLAYDILKDFNPMDVIPRHGPGAVATGEKHEKKWTFSRKYTDIHRVYPYYEYFVPSRSSLLRAIPSYKKLESLESGTAKVKLVSKDSRGPRLISMEPLEYQFIQQALAKELMLHLEKRCYYTRGYVNFEKQSINQSLALWNSISRRYATLDMKEASDRVSLQLVERVFSRLPQFLSCLKATRTTATCLPDGTILPLKKYAPMGSALCFPVESLIFFIVSEVIRRQQDIKGRVYVYGDDIIVPRELATVLFAKLPAYGLLFNEGKSFVEGYFRESCGLDSFKGDICTPVRVRKPLPQRRDPVIIQAAIDLSNRLFERGYWKCADYVKSIIDGILRVRVIRSTKVFFGGLSYSSFSQKGVVGNSGRWNKNYQAPEIRAYLLVNKTRKSNLNGDARLFSNFCSQLSRDYVVPHATQIKLRWASL